MTTLEPEQKDILEKLNEIALETNWGTVERVNGMPKHTAVIQEAIEEIKRLRGVVDRLSCIIADFSKIITEHESELRKR